MVAVHQDNDISLSTPINGSVNVLCQKSERDGGADTVSSLWHCSGCQRFASIEMYLEIVSSLSHVTKVQ